MRKTEADKENSLVCTAIEGPGGSTQLHKCHLHKLDAINQFEVHQWCNEEDDHINNEWF